MANTTNLNLVKLEGQEKLKTFPADQADNMDAIDGAFGAGFGMSGKPSVNASINNLANGLAIISNGNTHAAISSGQFVYVRNHASLSEGLYIATTSIAANGTLSGSNVTADTSGGLNALNSKVTYDTLINLQQITSSYVTRNTYNSRKFSDYKMLVFTPYENNWARTSCIVPTFVFENATGIDIRYYQGGNLIEVDIKRTSDTSYDAKYIGTPPSGEGVFIYCFGVLGN